MTRTSVHLLLASLLPFAAGSAAVLADEDCVHQWDASIGLPGVETGVIKTMLAVDDKSGPGVIVGGDFDSIGGVAARNIARWNGSTFEPMGEGLSQFPGVGGDVRALCVFDDGSGPAIYAGGYFAFSGEADLGFSIARWNGEAWTSVGGGLQGSTPQVNALTVYNDGGGDALIIGGQLRSPDASVNDGIVAWTGDAYESLGSGLGNGAPVVRALAVAPLPSFQGGSDGLLVVGGIFQWAGGVSVASVASWNGASWAPLDEGIGGPTPSISHAVTFDDGTGPAVYMTGYFTEAGGETAFYAARWAPGLGWEPLGNSYMNAATLQVFDLGDGPEMLAASPWGQFLAWRDGDWQSVAPNVWGVNAMTVLPDESGRPELYLGGSFTAVQGRDANRLARWRCTCRSDLTADRTVDAADLTELLTAWGETLGHVADLNGDGQVDASDLALLLSGWDDCAE